MASTKCYPNFLYHGSKHQEDVSDWRTSTTVYDSASARRFVPGLEFCSNLEIGEQCSFSRASGLPSAHERLFCKHHFHHPVVFRQPNPFYPLKNGNFVADASSQWVTVIFNCPFSLCISRTRPVQGNVVFHDRNIIESTAVVIRHGQLTELKHSLIWKPNEVRSLERGRRRASKPKRVAELKQTAV